MPNQEPLFIIIPAYFEEFYMVILGAQTKYKALGVSFWQRCDGRFNSCEMHAIWFGDCFPTLRRVVMPSASRKSNSRIPVQLYEYVCMHVAMYVIM